jgi:beta-galactosidase GanA
MGRKPIVGLFSVGLEEPYRWKDSVQSEAEIRIWVADGVANDLRPWFTKFSGALHDQRWLRVVEEVFNRYARWEPYLRNQASLARVGLVYSQQTAWFYGGEHAGEKVEDYTLGWYQALIESRIPFEMVHDRLLDRLFENGQMGQFRTLILPNIAALSDSQCRQLREYVAQGGNLIATHETSLYDEWGARRKEFGPADLFG